MPPNVNELGSASALDLSSHIVIDPKNIAQLSKYPPLTSSFNEDNDTSIFAPCEDEEQSKSMESSWKPMKPMTRTPSVLFRAILQEEAARVVSCDNIEANLIADSSAFKNEEPLFESQPNEDGGYWDMTSEDDHEPDLFSVGQIERLLVEDAVRRAQEDVQKHSLCTSASTHDSSHPTNSYWEWPSKPSSASELKTQLIAKILREEAIRETLSIDHISMVEQCHATSCSPQVTSNNYDTDFSSSYWSWGEEKSEMVAPHVGDPTHPNNAYWDFPSEPELSDQEKKNKLIDTILRDERIREILSCSNIEEREVTHSALKEKNNLGPFIEGDMSNVHAEYWVYPSTHSCFKSPVLEQTRQDLINKIMEDEKSRCAVSTEKIVENLVQNSEIIQKEERMDVATDASYWAW